MLARAEQLLDEFRDGLRTVVFGLLGANVLALVFGFLTGNLHETVDRPVFDRIAAANDTWLTTMLRTVTKMGNEWPTLVVAVAGAVGLAVWFAARGWHWWMPLLTVPAAWFATRSFLLIMIEIVERPRNRISLTAEVIGGYPSGGVTRVLVVFGLLAYLAVHYAQPSSRTRRILFVALACSV